MPDFTTQVYFYCPTFEGQQKPCGKYTVRWDKHSHKNRDVQYDFSCNCNSYKFQNGTDSQGYCKHIRDTQEQFCIWHEATGEPVVKEDGNFYCPECGLEAKGEKWLV